MVIKIKNCSEELRSFDFPVISNAGSHLLLVSPGASEECSGVQNPSITPTTKLTAAAQDNRF